MRVYWTLYQNSRFWKCYPMYFRCMLTLSQHYQPSKDIKLEFGIAAREWLESSSHFVRVRERAVRRDAPPAHCVHFGPTLFSVGKWKQAPKEQEKDQNQQGRFREQQNKSKENRKGSKIYSGDWRGCHELTRLSSASGDRAASVCVCACVWGWGARVTWWWPPIEAKNKDMRFVNRSMVLGTKRLERKQRFWITNSGFGFMFHYVNK